VSATDGLPRHILHEFAGVGPSYLSDEDPLGPDHIAVLEMTRVGGVGTLPEKFYLLCQWAIHSLP
jgi:hypothetical protein